MERMLTKHRSTNRPATQSHHPYSGIDYNNIMFIIIHIYVYIYKIKESVKHYLPNDDLDHPYLGWGVGNLETQPETAEHQEPYEAVQTARQTDGGNPKTFAI